jgi:hypothetical protein
VVVVGGGGERGEKEGEKERKRERERERETNVLLIKAVNC